MNGGRASHCSAFRRQERPSPSGSARRFLGIPAAMAVVTLAATNSINAQTMTLDTLSLSDLPGVRVEIEPYLARAHAEGLHPDSLRALVEARLTGAGIRLLTEDEWQVTLGNPLLLLRLDLLRASEFFYLYSMRLELQQLVVLARDSTIPAFAATWTSESTIGSVQTANLGSLRSRVIQQVERFIAAQAAAQRAYDRWIRPVRRRR